MKTSIYYYSGTGNSLWTAHKLSETLGDAQKISIKLSTANPVCSASEIIGIIFPVHIWGLPEPIIEFVNRLEIDSSKYYFAVGVNAGQVAATLIQLKKLMQARGLNLCSGFSINLPSNYIPWGGAISPEKQQKLFLEAIDKIKRIASSIRAKQQLPPDKGPAWQNIILSMIYRKSFPYVTKMDKSFWADEKCTNCAICEKICPALNISVTNGKPSWKNRCEQCFACLQWCPEEAIQYGKNTSKKKRYHHPEIKLADMLASVPSNKLN